LPQNPTIFADFLPDEEQSKTWKLASFDFSIKPEIHSKSPIDADPGAWRLSF